MPAVRKRKAWPGGATQAVARACNHTCIELSSVQSTRTRFEPLCQRGHIDHVQLQPEPSGRHRCALHALAEFCFSGTSNSAVLCSSQRELSNAHEITFPDAREAKALWTPLGAVG
eukprot:scaffold2423_cov113-Isochrysis_galbana.AAC.11